VGYIYKIDIGLLAIADPGRSRLWTESYACSYSNTTPEGYAGATNSHSCSLHCHAGGEGERVRLRSRAHLPRH